MSDAKSYFTAVLAVHETTTTDQDEKSLDTYGRTVRTVTKPVKTSHEVVKIQLRGSTLAEVAAKAGNVLGAMEGAL
ncbi:hypothetical protein J2Y69_003366 [Microbacterium resistens]|uniref:Uncharacterized protein n=1 Tax=Microbacterium resistens TaxID=156977 RepID=A0ABU1SGR8_9MICO|nr:hypothetical protein [Microbacterium resistens]MDR6868742.1 hypothetical protein [Microbacterium resistens]